MTTSRAFTAKITDTNNNTLLDIHVTDKHLLADAYNSYDKAVRTTPHSNAKNYVTEFSAGRRELLGIHRGPGFQEQRPRPVDRPNYGLRVRTRSVAHTLTNGAGISTAAASLPLYTEGHIVERAPSGAWWAYFPGHGFAEVALPGTKTKNTPQVEVLEDTTAQGALAA